MPRLRCYRVGKGLLALLLVFVAGGAAPAGAIDFNAYWLYRASGGEDLDTQRTLEQRYSLGAGPGVMLQPTHAISASGDVSYRRTERRMSDGDSATVEDITPSGSIGVNNDIFRAGLFGTALQRRVSGGADQDSRSWEATLGTGWDRRLWPNLRLYYGEGATSSEDGALDTEDSRYGLDTDWDLLAGKLFYSYGHSRFDDLAGGSRSEQDSHLGRLETGGTFWQNRLNVQFSQQLQHTTSEFSIDVAEGEAFERRLGGGVTLFENFSPQDPLRPDPEFADPPPNSALGDGDREEAVAASLDLDERGHFGIRFSALEQVDRLHLYVPLDSPLTPAQAGALQWDLYTRILGEGEWTLEAQGIPVVFNSEENRIELEIGLPARELQVVVTNTTGGSLDFTELEAIELLTESQEITRISHLTNATMRVRLTETLTASSSVALERSGEDWAGSDSSRRALSANLRWTPVPVVSPSVGFSETREDSSGAPEAINRAYSLIVATFPLPTLNVTLGATRTDRYTGSRKDSTTDRYSLSSTARLYPDLTAGFDASYAIADRAESESAAASTTETLSNRLTLNARLHPKLTGDLTVNYTNRETGTDSFSSLDSTVSLGYRPSDLLSVRATHTRNWTNERVPDTLAVNTNLALLRTEKTRVNFRHLHSQGEQTRNRFGLDGSWDMSRNLTLQGRGDYTVADADRWNVEASLSLRI